MTALTTGRNTFRVEETRITLPVAANVTIFEGAIVVVDSLGNAWPVTAATDRRVVGRADERVTNGAVAGAVTIKISRGMFWYENDTSEAITRGQINMNCWLKDDQTVSAGATGRNLAGRIVDVSPTLGVCVELGIRGIGDIVSS